MGHHFLIAIKTLASAALCLAMVSSAWAQTVPDLKGFTLAGDPVHLPDDLAPKGDIAPASILILSFDRLAEADAAPWRSLARRLGVRHLTLIVMGEQGGFARARTSGSLRADAPATAPRNAIAPIYVDPAKLRTALGLPWTASVQTVLVDATGRVHAVADGRLTAEAEQRFAEGLGAIRSGNPASTPRVAALAVSPSSPPPPTSSKEMSPAGPAPVQPQPILPPPPPPATPVAEPRPSRALPLPSPPAPVAEGPMSGYTLAGGKWTEPGSAAVLVLATSPRDIDALIAEMRRLDRDGACAAGCEGLVAMGDNPGPTRAIAAGRLRGDVADKAMRARIVPVFVRPEVLHRRFAAETVLAPVMVVQARMRTAPTE